jgi:hypothetical protein
MHVDDSAAEIKTMRHALSLPVIVLTAALSEGSAKRAQIRSELQQSQVKLSAHGCQIIATKSKHVIRIQLEEPEAVVDAIHAVVGAHRTGNDPLPCSTTPSTVAASRQFEKL